MNKVKVLESVDLTDVKMKVFVEHFNQMLLTQEVIFRLVINEKFDCIDIKPSSDKYVHDCIINITDAGLDWIRNYFKSLGYKVSFNNTASCFWLSEISTEVKND